MTTVDQAMDILKDALVLEETEGWDKADFDSLGRVSREAFMSIGCSPEPKPEGKENSELVQEWREMREVPMRIHFMMSLEEAVALKNFLGCAIREPHGGDRVRFSMSGAITMPKKPKRLSKS